MRRARWFPAVLVVLAFVLGAPSGRSTARAAPEPASAIAFTSFAPLDTDIFIAAADGSNPRPLLPHPDLDSNASFSSDGQWIVFTSTRNGSADVYRVHADGSGLERLTDDPAFDDQGALSPDGRSLAFVSSRSGQADIWILELAEGTLRNVSSHPAGDFRPQWSPDGRRIAFSSDRDSKKPTLRFSTLHSTEIYVVGVDGAGLRRITHRDAVAGSPAWSADGTRLVYYEADITEVQNIRSPAGLRATTQIVSTDLTTNTRQILSTGSGEKWSPHYLGGGRIGYASGGPDGGIAFVAAAGAVRGEARSPSWSPDGRQVVFHRDIGRGWPPHRTWPSRDPTFPLVRTGAFPSYAPGGDRLVLHDQRTAVFHTGVLVMNADGTRRSTLFRDPARSALTPAWSPLGDRIAITFGQLFQSVQGPPAADIAVMHADGTGLRILTDGAGNHGFPSWSPDGRRLVYRTAAAARNGLSIIDVATGRVNVVTSGSAHDNFPSWSPRGDRIAFTSDREGDFEIHSIRPDGTDLRRLTSTPGNDAHNAWSPDGEWIVFTSARGGFKDESALHPYNPQPYGDLYVMRADGSDVRMLTDNQFEEGTPNWVPAPRAK